MFDLRVRLMALGVTGRHLSKHLNRAESTIAAALQGRILVVYWRIVRYVTYLERKKAKRDSDIRIRAERAAKTLRQIDNHEYERVARA